VLLVALTFLASSGFLVLHALATPGVLLAGKNAGFQVATPIGLLLASAFAAVSALDLSPESARGLVRARRLLYGALVALMAGWAALSLSTLPPLEDPIPAEETRGPLVALALAGVLFFGFAAVRYGLVWRRRRAPLVLAVVAGLVLLAEAMFAIAFSRNWHATWWEWHLLMLVGFAVVARSAWREWQVEGSTAEIFSDIYEERTRAGERVEVSVLFADLQGFTPYSERTPDEAVKAMLDDYWAVATPVVDAHGAGERETIGDALMVLFEGERHEERAARAGLAFQEETGRLAARHPDWPRFRIGINSGEAVLGVVLARGARAYGVTGDVVNVAARLEKQARVGEVVVSGRTREALGGLAKVEDLGEIDLKGKAAPVRVFLLRSLAPDGHERDQRLEHEEREAER
jgi:class 3 adenylate cyclase